MSQTPAIDFPTTLGDLPGPKGLPLLGNLLQLKKHSLHQILESWADQFGPCYRLKLGRKQLFVVSDPDLIRTALHHRPKQFRRRQIMEDAAETMGVNGVFTADGDRWRSQRRLAVQAFAPQNLKALFPNIVASNKQLLTHWINCLKSDQPVDLQKDLRMFTADQSTRMAFGHDVNSFEQDEDLIHRHLDKILPIFNRRINSMMYPFWKHVRLPSDRDFDASLDGVKRYFLDLITNARRQLAKDRNGSVKPRNLMEAMILARKDTGETFDDDEIFTNVFSVLLAGQAPVAITLTWALYFVARHPQTLMDIRAEVDKAGEGLFKQIEAVDALRYTEAVLEEVLRLKPVAPMISVQANEDVALGGLRFKKGTIILLLPRVNTMKNEFFEGAQSFQPDRWLKTDGNEAGDISIPFGHGPRHCVGHRLARLEMKFTLAMLCDAFDVDLLEPAKDIQEVYEFLMHAEQIPFSLTLRPHAETLQRRLTSWHNSIALRGCRVIISSRDLQPMGMPTTAISEPS